MEVIYKETQRWIKTEKDVDRWMDELTDGRDNEFLVTTVLSLPFFLVSFGRNLDVFKMSVERTPWEDPNCPKTGKERGKKGERGINKEEWHPIKLDTSKT